MANIAIMVRGISATGSNAFTVDYEVLPEGAPAAFPGGVGEPFTGDPNGINNGIIGAAKFIAGSNGFPVNDGDAVLLIGGLVVPPPAPLQTAHVVMKGTAVDSVFTDDAAAQARASALAAATDGSPQDEAIKAAPWIATAPVNPG